MNFSIIPWWWKALAAAALVAALWLGFKWWRAGVVQEGWDARDLSAQAELVVERDRYQLLVGQVREQNRAVEAMAAAGVVAEQRRKQAEAVAAGVIKGIDKRAAAVGASTATNCDGVMRQAWEKWK